MNETADRIIQTLLEKGGTVTEISNYAFNKQMMPSLNIANNPQLLFFINTPNPSGLLWHLFELKHSLRNDDLIQVPFPFDDKNLMKETIKQLFSHYEVDSDSESFVEHNWSKTHELNYLLIYIHKSQFFTR